MYYSKNNDFTWKFWSYERLFIFVFYSKTQIEFKKYSSFVYSKSSEEGDIKDIKNPLDVTGPIANKKPIIPHNIMAAQNSNDLVVAWYAPLRFIANPHEIPQGYLKNFPRYNG